jgi:hypothetical protein
VLSGTRFAAPIRNRTPSRAESLKLINVTKHAERDGFRRWTAVKEVSRMPSCVNFTVS